MRRLVQHGRLPLLLHRIANVAFGLLLVPAVTVGVTLEALGDTGDVCEGSSDCARSFNCIDSRCMCNPLWAHTGDDCSDMSWTSWVLIVVLVLVTFYATNALATAARKGSPRSTTSCSGVYELVVLFFRPPPENDSGGTTMRVVIGTAMIEAISHIWKILAAGGVFSDRTSAYWDERLFFPLAEGSYLLASAIVISVWIDVANSSMSRAKSKRKLDATKRALEMASTFYMAMLAVLCAFDHLGTAMTLHLVVLSLGIIGCGMGAAKLCSALRTSGENNTVTANTVFKVSRSMGFCFYGMFVGNAMILSSRTRKSHPTNLALLGVTVASIGKCFLNKAIFEYACESARAKRIRAEAARRNQSWSVKSRVKSSTSLLQSVNQSSFRLQQKSSHPAMKVTPTEEGAGQPLHQHDSPTGLVDRDMPHPPPPREGGDEVDMEAETDPAPPSGDSKTERMADTRIALPDDATLVEGDLCI